MCVSEMLGRVRGPRVELSREEQSWPEQPTRGRTQPSVSGKSEPLAVFSRREHWVVTTLRE